MSWSVGFSDEVSEFDSSKSHPFCGSPHPYDALLQSRLEDDGADESDHERDESDNYQDDIGDSDSDVGEMGVRALAYDPHQLTHSSGLPVNGHDYLKLVQEERARLPAIVTVPRPACNVSAKKSTQSSAIPMELVLHCDEEIGSNQENCMPSQQSSLYPMDTSLVRDLPSPRNPSRSSSFSSDENLSDNNPNSSIYSGMASKEFREQIRLKSIGCTPLNRNSNKRLCSPTVPSTITVDRDSVPCDSIMSNFAKLRSKIEIIRIDRWSRSEENCDNSLDGVEVDEDRQERSGKRADKNLSRSERRALNFLRIMNIGHPPSLDALIGRSQMDIHLILEKLTEQCEKAPIYSTLHADWIYSLIALLMEPIESEICSTLRRVTKLCIARRDNYERKLASSLSNASNGAGGSEATGTSKALVNAVNEQEYYACLLIICIVRHHFGQLDLY